MTDTEKLAAGIECPHCGCPESYVDYTRKRAMKVNDKLAGSITRGRICEHCRRRFTTSERLKNDE